MPFWSTPSASSLTGIFTCPGRTDSLAGANVDLVTNSQSARARSERSGGARTNRDVWTNCMCRSIEPVIIEVSSKDVIHNFALPHMRIAQDAIPGSLIPMWFKPIKTGTYEIVCGQLCGLGHYSMKGTIVVDTPGRLSGLAEGARRTGGNTQTRRRRRPNRQARRRAKIPPAQPERQTGPTPQPVPAANSRFFCSGAL